MTVNELIKELEMCNADLPVFFEADCCTGLTVGAAEFRSYKPTGDRDTVEIGWALDKPCVLIVNRASVTDPCGDCGKQCDEPEAGYCWKCLEKVQKPNG